MEQHEREYVRSLPLARKMEYYQRRWGCRPNFAIDLVEQPSGRWALVGTAAVLNTLLAAELNWPPPVVLATRVTPTTNVERFLGDLLECWEKAIIEHNERIASGRPSRSQ